MKRAAALVVLAGLVAGCSDDGPTRVEVREVTRATVAEVVDAPGAVTARATASVGSPADAVVEAVLVRDGDTVTAGQVLVQLASPAAQERLRQALAARAQAAASVVDLPQADLSPLQDAVDAAAQASFAAGRAAAARIPDPAQRVEAEQQVAAAEERYRAAAAASRAALAQAASGVQGVETALNAVSGAQRAQADAAVAVARRAVDALTVKAPLTGVVQLGGTPGGAPGGDLGGLAGALPPELADAAGALGGGGGPAADTSAGLAVGTPVGPGTPLVTVTDVSGLSVTAEIDETDVLLVKPGVTARVELDAVPDAQYPAVVTAVDVTPTTSARGGVSYRVRLDLRPGSTAADGPAPTPRPGMSAVVDLQVRTARNVLAVPTSAVVRDGARDVVFVVSDGVAERREVVLGADGEDRVEVVEGVAAGDRVVVRDADRLRDGQPVET